MQRQDFCSVDEAEEILQLTYARAYRECFAPTRSWGRTSRGRRSDCSGT